MADNVVANPGAGGATFATDDDGTAQHPYTKLEWGPNNTFTKVDDAGGARLPVKVGEALPAGTNNIGDVDVLTVPAPLSTAGGGTEATALRVTVANDSTGLLSVDDNGGSLTVDGPLTDAQLRATSVPVTVSAALPAGANNIGDVDVLTVPAPLSTTGGGTEATALRVTVANDSTGLLSVDDNGGSLTVDGSVTANAGTNLNTSALALEAGGNLAAAAASLSILDDWDESDRAKVNIIVGQAGVAAGVGATGATVPRVVQANDAGKTLLSTGGSASASGNNTLVAAGTNKLKVYAFSLSTRSTTAMTCIFQSGASGTELWRVVLQAPTSVSTGANLAISPPAYLFSTATATLLNLNLDSANAVHWSVSYFDEA